MAQFAIGAGKNIHLNCKKQHQHATDEILGKDRNPKGSGKSQFKIYDITPKNRRSPRHHHRQQNKRRAD
jgi:hypothetical protein